jgi:hypothetical protein
MREKRVRHKEGIPNSTPEKNIVVAVPVYRPPTRKGMQAGLVILIGSTNRAKLTGIEDFGTACTHLRDVARNTATRKANL